MCGISFLDNKNSFRDLVGNGSELTVLHEIHLNLVKRCIPWNLLLHKLHE